MEAAFGEAIVAQLDRLLAAEETVRAGADPEAVHRMRVAIRRPRRLPLGRVLARRIAGSA